MKIFEDQYWKVFFNQKDNLIETEWKQESEFMDEEDFKQHIIIFAETVEKYRPKGFITDSRNGHFTMVPILQTWHDETIAPTYVRSGLKKIAFILPTDIFTAVSLQQTFEEQKVSIIQFRNFDDMKEARDWMRE